MASMVLTDGGLRPITDGDRAIISRTNDPESLRELLRQMLDAYKSRRTRAYGATTLIVAVLAVTVVVSLFLGPPQLTFGLFAAFGVAYFFNRRARAASNRRFASFNGWFDAIRQRLEELDAGQATEVEAPPAKSATYELAGLPAPVFIGSGVRQIREEDRLVIRSCKDVDALRTLQVALRARAKKPEAGTWLERVDARLLQLDHRN